MRPRFFCFSESPRLLTHGRRNHKKKEKRPGPRNSSNRLNLKGNSKPRLRDSSASNSKLRRQSSSVNSNKLKPQDNTANNSKPRPQSNSANNSRPRPQDSSVSNSKPGGNNNSVSSRLDLLNLPSAHGRNRIDNVRSQRSASAPGAAVEFQTIASVLILDVSMSSASGNHDWLADILGSSMAGIGLDSSNHGR